MRARVIIKSVIAAYIITGLLLLLTAFLLYTLEPEQSLITMGIVAIYVLSCFLGGLLTGKKIRNRKFFWGMLTGLLYFALLFVVSWIGGSGIHDTVSQVATTFVLCVAGGMLGGMLA